MKTIIDCHITTELGCDVKTVLLDDRRMKPKKNYRGVLRCDSQAVVDEFLYQDPHFTFVETRPEAPRRYPRVFDGRFITVTRRDDGTLHPNFKAIPAGMSVERYAFGVYRELHQALSGLIGEWGCRRCS